MSIKTFSEIQNTLRHAETKNWTRKIEEGPEFGINFKEDSTGNQSFGEFLAQSIAKVNQAQIDANEMIQKISSGESEDVASTLIAVEKAEIAFKTMNQIRSKVIDAYQEIMKMQV